MLLDRVHLCEALGVSDSSISAWEKKGMPVVRKGRGQGKKSIYDFDRVKAWCDKTGHGMGMDALLKRSAAAPAPASSSPPANSPVPIAEGLLRAMRAWLLEVWASGYCAPDFEAADLADLAGVFLEQCARALGPDIRELMRQATDFECRRPTMIEEAVAHIDACSTKLAQRTHG